MTPNTPENVRKDYDKIAADYAEHLYRELEHKAFDREVLTRFASDVGNGEVCDLGCGPGHVAAFLARQGVRISGLDLSPAMISEAQRFNPGIPFRVGNMLALHFAADSLAGIVAFYAIVNMTSEQIVAAFGEMPECSRRMGCYCWRFTSGKKWWRRARCGETL